MNRYNFLRKETQPEIRYIDLQARFYDPTIGRFIQANPETEGQLEFSPDYYSFNNPVLFSDPDCRFCIVFGPKGRSMGLAFFKWAKVQKTKT